MSLEGAPKPRQRYGGFEKVDPVIERQYHSDRWERIAQKRNAIAQEKDPNAKLITREDVMRESADVENMLYEKWKSAKYAESDKHLHAMTDELREIRDDPSKAPENFCFVTLGLGAGVASSQRVGQDMALKAEGLDKLIDYSVDSSGSTGPSLFRAEGEPEKGASIFMNDVPTERFLHYELRGTRPVLDTGVISSAMRNGPKAVNLERLRASHTECWAIVTNKTTGKAELKNMTDAEDPMVWCEASSAIPGMKISSVTVDGVEYVDGAFSDIPLDEIIRKFKPTHLLIQPNRAFELVEKFKNTLGEDFVKQAARIFSSISPLAYSVKELSSIKNRVGTLLEKAGAEYGDIVPGGVKIAIMWPAEEGVDMLTQDSDIIRTGILESCRKAISDMGAEQPQEIHFMPGDELPPLREEKLREAA